MCFKIVDFMMLQMENFSNEEKIQSLQDPDFMGKIQKALIQYPNSEKLIEQKKVLDQPLLQIRKT